MDIGFIKFSFILILFWIVSITKVSNILSETFAIEDSISIFKSIYANKLGYTSMGLIY
jgi:hypothetical protein